LRTPKAIVSVFKMLDRVTKEGWPHIPRKLSKEDAIEEACSSNIVNEVSTRELFKLFLQSLECIKIDIFSKLLPTIVAF
jgi:hypothetical protein